MNTVPIVKASTLTTTNLINYKVFVILGNQWGDEGKGKAMRFYLIEQGSKAKYCIRFNGGPNAGHTIYVRPDDDYLFITDNKKKSYNKPIKFATHQVPTGVIFGIPSYIGYNCVVDLVKLYKEIEQVASQLGRTYEELADLITIVPEAHVISPKHIQLDQKNNSVGTTGSGIGPCYSEKALRTGFRIGDYCKQHIRLYNKYPEFTDLEQQLEQYTGKLFEKNKIIGINIGSCDNLANSLKNNDIVVMEGAQGFHLDPNLGQYPFVTSADCTIAGVYSYGFYQGNISSIGLSKAYTTYVGSQKKESKFDPNVKHSGEGELLRLLGREYGVTTGRRRQCLWLNLDLDFKALRVNRTEQWIISKSDILIEYNEALNELKNYCINKDISKIKNNILKQYIKEVGSDIDYFGKLINNGAFNIIHNGIVKNFNSWETMKEYIVESVSSENLPNLKKILWWDSPASEIYIEYE